MFAFIKKTLVVFYFFIQWNWMKFDVFAFLLSMQKMLQKLIKISCCIEINDTKNAVHRCNVHCTGFKKYIVHFEKFFSMHVCTLNNSYPFLYCEI